MVVKPVSRSNNLNGYHHYIIFKWDLGLATKTVIYIESNIITRCTLFVYFLKK